jgi:hypothetical protein
VWPTPGHDLDTKDRPQGDRFYIGRGILMITMIIALKRAAHVTHDFFATSWEDGHGPLVMTLPEFTQYLLSYRQFFLVDYDTQVSAIGWGGGAAPDFDGVALLSFADAESMRTGFAQPRFQSIAAPDADRFADIPGSASYLTRTISSSELPASHNGGISLFEFADSGVTPMLKDWVENASEELKPISVDQYQSLAEDDVDSSSPTPQVQLGANTACSYITVCGFVDANTARKALTSLEERNSASSGSKPVYALVREHTFI